MLRRILLVEDSANDIELTLEALQENSLANEVVVTRDGEEALEYLYRRGRYEGRNEGQPAVILLDLKMPKVGGLEVLRQIKSDPEKRHIPIVMLTSSREEPDLEKCYEFGANAYVVKPVDFNQFIGAIKNVGLFWGLLNEIPSRVLQT